MERSKEKINLQKRTYFALTAIMVIMAVIFILLADFVMIFQNKEDQTSRITKREELRKEREEKEIKGTKSGEREKVLIIAKQYQVYEEILDYKKIEPVAEDSIHNIKKGTEYSLILIDGEMLKEEKEQSELVSFCQYYKGSILVFHADRIQNKSEELKALMGIEKEKKEKKCKGVRILNDFMFDRIFEDPNFIYQVTEIKPKSGSKIYITEYAKNYVLTETIPLLYRYIYKNVRIYTCIGPLMELMPQGIIAGILSQTGTDYLYPIVDSSFLAAEAFPILSTENSEYLKKQYGRDSQKLIKDILLSDVLMISENLEQKLTALAKEGFSQYNSIAYKPENIEYYYQEITKRDGELGAVLNEKNYKQMDTWFQKYASHTEIQSCQLESFNILPESLKETIGCNFRFQSEGFFVPWRAKEYMELPVILNPLKRYKGDLLNYYSFLYAYGISSSGFDLKQVFYPKEKNKDWADVSKEISKFLGQYKVYFKYFKPLTGSDTANQLLRYEIAEPDIIYQEDKIFIQVQYFKEEISFILKTRKDVAEVENGNSTKLGQNFYLIRINNKTAVIKFKPSKLEYPMDQ